MQVSQTDNNIEKISKIDQMDLLLESSSGSLTYTDICTVVQEVFAINLDIASLTPECKMDSASSSSAVIDAHLSGKEMTGSEVRAMILRFFGVNLNGIASLEKTKISLYSKRQWIVQKATDLIVVYTGSDDVDVSVYATDYFKEKTGSAGIPNDLQKALMSLGFTYDEANGSCYYANPTGQAVPDAFKGQTIGAIAESLHNLSTPL
ncbi:hypothetical protein FITA111629_10980 [Filibacter tadaridae]|uniref:Uncharacterized protein n=1 Tax=Filibacter tadaridae TaxID=2483811 RepID=A0A3P5X937_9BACL|nr:hypothetical protein [Filibacter tadaridae]VDC24917.1 hypothetical protein FILTAD_01124 [Filibacter tadaridae]